jgi:hypothetical protein
VSRPQQIVVLIYCLLLAYCCVWIPWRLTFGIGERKSTDVAYSLVWAAPNFGYAPGYSAVPDMRLVLLRIIAVTATAAAVFFLVGFKAKHEATRD